MKSANRCPHAWLVPYEISQDAKTDTDRTARTAKRKLVTLWRLAT